MPKGYLIVEITSLKNQNKLVAVYITTETGFYRLREFRNSLRCQDLNSLTL